MNINKTSTHILTAGLISVMCFVATAAAENCEIAHERYLIAGADEVSAGGVPNYSQHDLYGRNDCGPVAAAALLGYWDANGYPCLIPGSPYYDDLRTVTNAYQEDGAVITVTEAPDRIRHLVNDLKEATHYRPLWGTPPGIPIGDDILRVAAERGAGDGWSYNEDELISLDNIKRHLDEDRPMLMCIRSALFGGGQFEEYMGDAANGTFGDTSWHWMTMLGYEHFVQGVWGFGRCWDWFNTDEVFLHLRLTAIGGSNHNIAYHMGMLDDLYTVDITPSFPPEDCVDIYDGDGDGFGSRHPGVGMTPGQDCDDKDPHTYPGAPELCDGYDNDCDGTPDESPDTDGDGRRDICDSDDDGDGVQDKDDNCPVRANTSQADYNRDGRGDACQCGRISARLLSQRIRAGVCPPPVRRDNPARNAPRFGRFFR